MPDIEKYCLVVQLCSLAFWAQPNPLTRRLEIENLWVSPVHTNAWPRNPPTILLAKDLLTSTLFSYNIWRQTKDKYHLSVSKSIMMSFFMYSGISRQPDRVQVRSLVVTRPVTL